MISNRIIVAAVVLTLTITLPSCLQTPQTQSISITEAAIDLSMDAVTPDIPSTGSPPPVDSDVDQPEMVVMAFLDEVTEGDLIGAKRFWEPEVWNTGIEQLVAGWASGRHEFSIGAVSYAGFVAPGDYRPLEVSDPRVQNALVEATIDGEQVSFALEKTSSGWLISGWIVSDKLQE